MFKVFVVGSLNQDLVIEVERHPAPGETVRGSSISRFPGGKGLNQAVASAAAGAPTVMIGCVGEDDAADVLHAVLAESGVDTKRVCRTPRAPTGMAIVTVCGGENAIVVLPGANGELTIDGAAMADLGAGDVVVAQFETPVGTTLHAFQQAKAIGAITLLNPAPAGAVPQALLDVTDIVVLNEHELGAVFGVAAHAIIEADILPNVVTERYNRILVLTLGAAGVVAWSQMRRYRAPGERVDVVDSTGAGDCFVGYLAAGIAAAVPLAMNLNRSNRAAALSVTRRGAATSIPTIDEINVSL
jgi:ribokinase